MATKRAEKIENQNKIVENRQEVKPRQRLLRSSKKIYPMTWIQQHAKRNSDIVCFKCGGKGHIQRECTHAMDRKCYKCGRVGHIQKLCKSKAISNVDEQDDARKAESKLISSSDDDRVKVHIEDVTDAEKSKALADSQKKEMSEQERNELLTTFKNAVGWEGVNAKPVNVIIFGTAGTGKSSFLNTAMTSLSDERRWYERAQVGNFKEGRQSTLHIVKYPREQYISGHKRLCFPIFFDIAGLEDENSFTVQEMIRVIIFGKLSPGESLQDLKRFIDSCGGRRSLVRRRYFLNRQNDRIDRIIFLATAKKETPLPLKLMDAVMDVGHSTENVVPIYGVLTHCDLVEFDDKDFLSKEEQFQHKLGLPENRYLRCKNYCDDYDRIHGTNHYDVAIPELDIPVIKFMTQVCCPKLIRPSTNAVYYRPSISDDGDLIVYILTAIVGAFVVILSIYALMTGSRARPENSH